jgi:hypothetical protein
MMMMTKMTRKWYYALFLIILPMVAYSQEKDFGIWYGVSAEHKLSGRLVIDLSADIRTFNSARKIEEAFLEGGITYSINKYASIAGSYRLSDNIENNNSYYFQHKWFLDLKGNIPIGDFSFIGRLRFQIRTKTYFRDESEDHPYYTGRIKLKVVYKTPTFPLDPYVYIESFSPMFSDLARAIEKERVGAGLEFSIAKHHSASLEYIFQRDYLPHLSNLNIISITYNIKL